VSNYAKSQNFTALRGTTPADPAIFDTEFALVATASATKMNNTGGTFSGAINVPAGATGTQAPQSGEMTTAIALKMDIAGGTFTGAVSVPSGGSGANVITSDEINSLITASSTGLSLAGGTMTGDINAIAGSPTGETTAVLRAQDVKHYSFTPGTKMAFFQASAPTGWTQDATQNDKLLRVVSSSGGGTGGTWNNSTGLTATGSAHTHGPGTLSGVANNGAFAGSPVSGAGLGGVSPAITVTVNGGVTASATSSIAMGSSSSWRPSYIDMIICTKN